MPPFCFISIFCPYLYQSISRQIYRLILDVELSLNHQNYYNQVQKANFTFIYSSCDSTLYVILLPINVEINMIFIFTTCLLSFWWLFESYTSIIKWDIDRWSWDFKRIVLFCVSQVYSMFGTVWSIHSFVASEQHKKV